MGGCSSGEVLPFDVFRFDRRECVLFRSDRAGVAEPVVLGSRAIGLLDPLLERRGELVAKDAIMEAVWRVRGMPACSDRIARPELTYLDRNRLFGYP
jgi:DNA-binding winged helix-turn-helix (wHTH) protein